MAAFRIQRSQGLAQGHTVSKGYKLCFWTPVQHADGLYCPGHHRTQRATTELPLPQSRGQMPANPFLGTEPGQASFYPSRFGTLNDMTVTT